MNPVLLRPGGFGGTAAANVPSPPADQLAPTEITNFRVDEAVDELTWSWDQSADVHTGTVAGEGIADYPFDRDASVVDIAAPAANVLAEPTYVQIGADSVVPTFTRLGNDLTIVSSGVGIGQTADEFGFAYWSRTGDFKLKVKIHSWTGASNPYAQCGLMIRETTAVGSKYIAFCQLLGADSKGIQVIRRLVADDYYYNNGGGLFGSAVGVDGPVWITVERVGNLWTYEYSFTNTPGSWLAIGVEPQAFASTVLIGGWAAANDFGDFPCTAVLRGLCWVPATRVSVVQSIAFPASVVGKVRARDLASIPNQADYTATLTGEPLDDEPPPGGELRWHPGSYPYIQPEQIAGTDNTAAINSNMDYACGKDPHINASVSFHWGAIETSFGVYDWTSVDAHITHLQAMSPPRRLIAMIWSGSQFGSNNYSETLPGYYIADPTTYGFWNFVPDPSGGFFPKIEKAAVQARIIAFHEAFAARYNGNPAVEGMYWMEETARVSEDSGFDFDALMLGYQNIWLATKAVCTNMSLATKINYAGNPENTRDLVYWLRDHGIVIGGPDVFYNYEQATFGAPTAETRRNTWAQNTGIGAGVLNCAGTDYDFGAIDLRGVVAFWYQGEQPEFDGVVEFGTHAQIGGRALDILKVSHYICMSGGGESGYPGNAGSSWPSFVTFMAARGWVTNLGCPSIFGGQCNAS